MPRASGYYEIFDLPLRLALDQKDLERRYYALSRRLHPDVYAGRTPAEQQAALDATAALNDAYRTLKDPAARAEYVLRENGVAGGGSAALVEEMFEWNTAMEDPARREQARAALAAMLEGTGAQLEARFREYDVTGGREALLAVREILDRRRYIERLLER